MQKFQQKKKMVNRFAKCVNRFRQLKDKPEGYEDAMKMDMYHTKNESTQET